MNKIKEIIVEPNKIHVGSNFKLKIKAIRYASYEEIKLNDYNNVKAYRYSQLKGD